jgi:hypothetical protein
VQVYVDSTVISPDSVLAGNALGSAVQPLPVSSRCITADEVDPDLPDEDIPTTGSG